MTTIRYEDDIKSLKEKYESGYYICISKWKQSSEYGINNSPTFDDTIFADYKLIHKKHEDILIAYINGKEIKSKFFEDDWKICDFINDYDEMLMYRTKETKSDYEDVKSYNVGTSNYSDMTIQPYDIFEAHPQLNYWECDIIKRILRSKSTDSRLMDYEKIEHIIKYLIKREKDNK